MPQNYKVEKWLDDHDPRIIAASAACPYCRGTAEQIRGNPPLVDVCAWCEWSEQLRVKALQGLI